MSEEEEEQRRSAIDMAEKKGQASGGYVLAGGKPASESTVSIVSIFSTMLPNEALRVMEAGTLCVFRPCQLLGGRCRSLSPPAARWSPMDRPRRLQWTLIINLLHHHRFHPNRFRNEEVRQWVVIPDLKRQWMM